MNHLRSWATQLLNWGRPQMIIITINIMNGLQAFRTWPDVYLMPVSKAAAVSFGKRQIRFGCQNFMNTNRDSIDTAEDRTAGSSGPTYRLMKKLGMA